MEPNQQSRKNFITAVVANADGEIFDLAGSQAINAAVKSVQGQLGDTGRVILRPSGTEPLIRVTLEGIDATQVNQLAEELAEVVRNEL